MSTNSPNVSPTGSLSGSAHRLRHLRARRLTGFQRSTLRSFIDRIETFDLAFDPEDRGVVEKWYEWGRKQFDQIVEIGPIEQLPSYAPPANGKTVVWYHKTIIISRQNPGKEYKINFARACYTTKVWCNGQLMTDVDGQTVHISGFSSFSYDLSPALHDTNRIELVVRVENTDDPALCRGKQSSTLHAREGIWYNQASGLWGQVTLEEVSSNRLRSDVTGFADLFRGQVKLNPITCIKNTGEYQLEVIVDSPEKQRIDSHPCVGIISLYNESWGCQDIGEESLAGVATRAYIKEVYNYVKLQRPDLLVVDNDGWEQLCEKGELTATDLHTLHIYANNFENWRLDLENIAGLASTNNARFIELAGKSAAIGDKYVYKAELPLMVSEWGGFGALYGGPAGELAKFSQIRQYKALLHNSEPAIFGDCYTQLGDVEKETNGLLDKKLLRLADPQFIAASTGLLGQNQDSQ